jgi:hypothetical protein
MEVGGAHPLRGPRMDCAWICFHVPKNLRWAARTGWMDLGTTDADWYGDARKQWIMTS